MAEALPESTTRDFVESHRHLRLLAERSAPRQTDRSFLHMAPAHMAPARHTNWEPPDIALARPSTCSQENRERTCQFRTETPRLRPPTTKRPYFRQAKRSTRTRPSETYSAAVARRGS